MNVLRNCRVHRAGPGKLAAATLAGIAGVVVTLGGTYAALNATAFNTSAQSVGSGTLKLTLADNGAGFTTAIGNLAPADVVNRYVDVTNGGSLDASALTLTVSDANSTKLTTDPVNGLHASVTQCTAGTWTAASGTCSGATSVLAGNVALKTLISTPSVLIAGALPAGTTLHLQIAVVLPDQIETTVNGVLPAATIQGQSASLTWTFATAQRTATTTNA
jgi:hypothetical protein